EDDLGRGTDVEIDRYYGAYFRGQFPNTLPVRPYGLIGLTRMETTENFPGGGSTGENYSGLSIGLGADVSLTDVVFVSVEYMRAVDSGGDEVTNLSLGLNGRF
ncbi:MAG TPA: porin family protein, partial [Alcanivorax sp.]|nr:porin family protein [Alcanivorax sp.]HCM66560.1 porin family protein [Alcanivorax sp.]